MANERKLSRKSLHEFFLFLAFFQRNRLPFLFFESLQEIGTFIANFEVFFFFLIKKFIKKSGISCPISPFTLLAITL